MPTFATAAKNRPGSSYSSGQWQTLRRLFVSPAIIFTTALLIRAAVVLHGMFAMPLTRLWGHCEAGYIAVSLLSGKGFSGAFLGTSVPTAWLTPAYPVLVTLVFAAFGPYTRAATAALLTINAFAGAATAVILQRVGTRYFGSTAGAIAAWIWALWYYLALFTLVIWDTEISALLVAVSLLMLPEVADSDRPMHAAGAGAFWGASCLWNPSLAALTAVSSLYLAWRQRSARLFACYVGAFLIVIAPWLIRNYLTFGEFVFLRSNLYAELHFANQPGLGEAVGDYTSFPDVSAEYQKQGERLYLAHQRAAFWDYVRHYRREFVQRCLWRLGRYWTNPPSIRWTWIPFSMVALAGAVIALRCNRDRALLLLSYLVVFPLVYYLTYTYPKYRHPIEPVIVLLVACTVTATISRVRGVTPAQAKS